MARRALMLVAQIGLITGILAFFAPISASALGPQGPDNSGTFPTTADHQYTTYFVVSNTTNVQIDDTYLKIYYPDNAARTIDVVNADNCSAVDPDYDSVGGEPHGTVDARFGLWRTTLDNTNKTEVTDVRLDSGTSYVDLDGGTCGGFSMNIPAGSLVYSPYARAYVAILHADKDNAADGQNAYRINAPGGIVGLIGKQDARNVGYEVIGRFDSDGDGNTYIDFNLKFAPDCTLTAPGWQSLRFYDADNGVAGIQPTPFYYRIYDQTTNSFLTNAEYRNPVNITGDSSGWNPGNQSNEYSTLEIWMEPGHQYEWRIYNVHDNNTIQVEQPYDSIYYNNPCSPAAMSPRIESYVNGAPGTEAELLDDVSFRFRADNDPPGLVEGITSYSGRVYRDNPAPAPDVDLFTFSGGGSPGAPTFRVPPGGPNPTTCSTGCTYTTNTGRGGNAAHIYNSVANFAIHGSRICAVFTINPRNTVEFPPVAETTATPVCIKIGKRPLYGVTGGDVWAGGTFGNLGACPVQNPAPFIRGASRAYTVPRPGFPATVVSAIGEYGAFSLGTISGFGSNRSVYNGSPAHVSWNLMFANNTTPPGSFYDGPPTDIGRCLTDTFSMFSAGLPSVGANNFNADTSPSRATTAGGTVTVNGGVIGANRRFVLFAPNASVVRIASNITYANGPYLNPDQMPEVVILTNGDIVVDPGVTQVDGILSAKGTLYTCVPASEIANRNTPSTFIRIDSPCGAPLTFNGTVIVEDVRMYRTFGATTVGGDNRAQPAEVFKLREDLFISEYGRAAQQNRQARTIYQKELPPRY